MPSITETLRKYLLRQMHRATLYMVARESRLDQSQLSRFLDEKRNLSGPSIDRLADYLNLELREKRDE